MVLVAMLFVWQAAEAQYYSWGSDAPMRWQQIKGEGVAVIAPDTTIELARRTLHYIHAVQPYVGEGFRYGALDIPFVLHPENSESNALVMWLPKRVDFLTTPAVESYSMPWIKQLVAHEYRHAVQYNNLNRGVPRVLSRFLGQQGSVTGLLFMPLWALEGDAVMNETAMSTYGRGLQPRFSLGYRAIGRAIGLSYKGKARKNIDRWFCGSYREYIPDHYELGYQINRYAYDRYGENIWDKVGRYGVRNPYVFATTHVGLKRYYNTTTNQLFAETFAALNDHWESQPVVDESSKILTPLPEKNYTTYRYPLQLNEAEVVAFKSDYARTTRIVIINEGGAEHHIAHVGALATRPSLHDGVLYWAQYEQSKLFEERVYTRLWRLDFNSEHQRPERIAEIKNGLYPTPSERGLAWVEYRPEGRYRLIENGDTVYTLPIGVELHGLAWDDMTKAYYALLTDDAGMAPVRLDREGIHPLRRAAYVTLSGLTARDGKLYYASIASGKDEIHCFDLMTTDLETRLTESAYGAFDASPSAEGLLMTTYSRRGYAVARLTEPKSDTILWSRTPENRLNPAYKSWPTINLDTVHYTPELARKQRAERPAKRYSRLGHALAVHSWAPLSFDPFEVIDEHEADPNIGITFLSQNRLSNTEAYASYGWQQASGSFGKFGLRYNGLGVRLSFDAMVGGNQQVYSVGYYDEEQEKNIFQPLPQQKDYYSLSASALLPLLFDRGGTIRQLTFGVGYNYSNGMVTDFDQIEWGDGKIANIETLGYNEGLHKLQFTAAYAVQAPLAYRDFLPRLGFGAQVGYAVNPTNSDFANLLSLYGNLYLPGVAPHHSIQVEGSYQNSTGGYRYPSGYAPIGYKSAALLPRGFTTANILSDNYLSCSLNYRMPLCYPEWGIPSVLFIKRIRLGAGFDAARFDYVGHERQIWSVGGELSFDFNVLRMPDSATSSLTIGCFRPSQGDVWISASLGLPF